MYHKILAKMLDMFVIVYLDKMLIYKKNSGQPYIDIVYWVLKNSNSITFLLIYKNTAFTKTRFVS